ncbi:MAG: hypothetical protein NXH75_13920, partial [Halobacteriovoraceae bacterium]|nr:hypothetical protein [Halobacteriovoraceae bacterium]
MKIAIPLLFLASLVGQLVYAKTTIPLPFETLFLTKEKIKFKERFGTFKIKRKTKTVCYPYKFIPRENGYKVTFPKCQQSIFLEKEKRGWAFRPEAHGATQKKLQTFIHFHFKKDQDELFYGLGTQYTHFILNGYKVPILAQEQGNGRGLQPLTFFQNVFVRGAQGHEFSTYMSQAFLLSSKAKAYYIESPSYMEADFTFDKVVRLSHHGLSGKLYSFEGKSLNQTLLESRKWLGQQETLPDWIHRGGILGLMGGDDIVRTRVERLLEAGSSLSGVWLQDWVGTRQTILGPRLQWNWRRSDTLYPNWESLKTFFKNNKLETLGYFNPYLADYKEGNELLDIAKEKNYLVTHKGKEFKVEMGGFKAYLVDLLNPRAYSWLKEILFKQAKINGLKGWMADFAEAYPIDPDNSHDHHRYIQMWQQLNKEVRVTLGNQEVAFHRAGSLKSLKNVGLFWLGDQTPTYDEFDGFKSTVKGLLSSGLNGVAYNHSDIGGYFAIRIPLILSVKRSAALLKRWMEVNAFTMVFRTHLGLNPKLLFQIDQSEEMIAEFSKWSNVFSSLFSYRKKLISEYNRTAKPPVRPLFLEFPNERETFKIDDQFMFGGDYLIAPLYRDYQETKRLYLPKGRWKHLWDNRIIQSDGSWINFKVTDNTSPVFK